MQDYDVDVYAHLWWDSSYKDQIIRFEFKDTYDYDVTYGDGTKVDVKTKERTVPPRENYNCTVADFNTKQKCDEYAFVSVLNDHSTAWYLGKISKKDFYKEAKFYKEGELDPDSPPNAGFYFRADCYNIPISKLNSGSNLDSLTEISYEGGHY